MPTIKRSLTRPEKLDHLARAKQMRAAGVDLQIREEWLEAARSLDIMIVSSDSMVYDLPGGGAAYAIWVRLVARRRLTLTDCKGVTDWDDEINLEGYFDDREPIWWLGHQDFPRRQVLNPRLNSLKFHGCDYTVEGVILFTGLKPMPELQHGMTVPFTLVLLDQNENEIEKHAELFVDRTWKRKNNFVYRKGALRDSGETSGTSEPGFSPNLNVGPVREPGAELPRNQVRGKDAVCEADAELLASLRKALSSLAQR